MAVLKHHEAPVTTVEWHPSDASVLATGGEDHQILQWDLAVERDTDEQNQDEESVSLVRGTSLYQFNVITPFSHFI